MDWNLKEVGMLRYGLCYRQENVLQEDFYEYKTADEENSESDSEQPKIFYAIGVNHYLTGME
ncbi:MAG: hypothetical protein OEY64_10855 [Nitrospinota bacterium]|nr:hypothetical protein [Nitrospinota bacterium]